MKIKHNYFFRKLTRKTKMINFIRFRFLQKIFQFFFRIFLVDRMELENSKNYIYLLKIQFLGLEFSISPN